jgi:hypothetical protein
MTDDVPFLEAPIDVAQLNRPVDVAQLNRPSSDRYKALVESLVATDRRLRDGEHPLSAAILALTAVIVFISTDNKLLMAGVGMTLRQLASALHDRRMGANPEMLSDPIESAGRRRRRTNLMSHQLRGWIVAALSILIEAKMKRMDAAKWIEATLSAYGVRSKGRLISANTILQWREQAHDTAPQAANEGMGIVNDAREMWRLRERGTQEGAKQVAALLIAIVARHWHSK